MAPPSARRRNDNLGFWLPLAATAAVMAAGLVAWIWNDSEKDETDELENESDYRALRPHSRQRQRSQQRREQHRGGGYSSDELTSKSQWDDDTEATYRPSARLGKRDQDQDKKNDYPDTADDTLTSSYFSSPLSRRRTGDSTYAEPSTSNLSAAKEKLSAFGSALGLFNEPDAVDKDFYRRRSDARYIPKSADDIEARERPPVVVTKKKKVAIVVSSEDIIRSIDGHYSVCTDRLQFPIDATNANPYSLSFLRFLGT